MTCLEKPSFNVKLSEGVSGIYLNQSFTLSFANNGGFFDDESAWNLFNTPAYLKKAVKENPGYEDFKPLREGLVDCTAVSFSTFSVVEALPENRRAVMVGAGDAGSTVTPLALDQFKEWLGIEESGGGNIRVSNIQMPSTGADFTGTISGGGILAIDVFSGSQCKAVSLDGFKTWLANNFFDVLVQINEGQWSGAHNSIPGYVISDSAGNGLKLSQINQYGNTEYGSLPSIITGWHTGEGYLLWVSGRIVVAK